MEFKDLLNDYMEATETSVDDLAAKIGVTRQLIYRWKEGKVTRPSCEAVRSTASLFESNAQNIVAQHGTKNAQYLPTNFAKNIHTWLTTTPNDTPEQLIAWQKSLALTQEETRVSFFKGKRLEEAQTKLTTLIENLQTDPHDVANRAKILHVQAMLLRLTNQAAKGLQPEEREALENKAWEFKVKALQLDPVSPAKLLAAAGCPTSVLTLFEPAKREEKPQSTSFSLFLPGEPWPYPGYDEPVVTPPINIPWQFFEREQEVGEILASWSDTKQYMESWFVTGERGAGKTSLLLFLYKLPLYFKHHCLRPNQFQQFKKHEVLLQQLTTVYVDFNDPTVQISMLYQIAGQLGFDDPESLNYFPEKNLEKLILFKQQMDIYLNRAIEEDKKTVILINDLHKLVGYGDVVIESFEGIWGIFLNYISVYKEYLTFCVSSRLSAEELNRKIEKYQVISNLLSFSRFESVILSPYREDNKTR